MIELKTISFRVPIDLYDKLNEHRRFTEESQTEYIKRLLTDHFSNNEYEPLNHNAKTIFSNRILMKFISYTVAESVVTASKYSKGDQAVIKNKAREFLEAVKEMI